MCMQELKKLVFDDVDELIFRDTEWDRSQR